MLLVKHSEEILQNNQFLIPESMQVKISSVFIYPRTSLMRKYIQIEIRLGIARTNGFH